METKLFDNIFPHDQKLDLSQAVLVPGLLYKQNAIKLNKNYLDNDLTLQDMERTENYLPVSFFVLPSIHSQKDIM
jgi:hypothetical protein